MQAGKKFTAVVLYIVAFLVSIRFFLNGRHVIAWMLLFGAFLLALIMLRARRP